MTAARAQHPAKYSDAILTVLAKVVAGRRRVLDPFAGTGRVPTPRMRFGANSALRPAVEHVHVLDRPAEAAR